MNDKQTMYKYCECARGETKHICKTTLYPKWSGKGWTRGEISTYKCTECGQEK